LDYPVVVHHLFSSPGHNYFTRTKFERGNAPVIRHREITLEVAKGIAGDRFEQGRYPITFFSLEVAELMETELEKSVDISDFRRNIIITGINLCELIGHRFTVGTVTFEGIAHCNPCPWMNAVIGRGAYALMKGRGGLRAHVIGGGKLGLGEQMLQCDITLAKTAITALTHRRLP
jgi:MOSC domain-containing protein YiiM